MKKIFLLLPLILFAFENVKINVNKKVLKKGELLIITITTHGKKIIFPEISKIDNTKVIATMIKENIVILNGELIDKSSKLYFLRPTQNITIPSLEIFVDGKIYKTKPIKIKVTN